MCVLGGGGACVRDWEWDVVVVFLVCSFVCLTFSFHNRYSLVFSFCFLFFTS